MEKQKRYVGIDCFRLIAAILVITIHTSPLKSLTETGDFILTRIFARLAVPFFFVTSGYFLFRGRMKKKERLKNFLKKTALLYGAAILLYLPLNLYNGSFRESLSGTKLLKDIVFDGTFYHLWYLPASMLGAVIVRYLIGSTGDEGALIVTSGLYLVGLYGDSYYGLSEKLPCLKAFYQAVFSISDYTRNGIFFAPLFFVLGALIAGQRQETENAGKEIEPTRQAAGAERRESGRQQEVSQKRQQGKIAQVNSENEQMRAALPRRTARKRQDLGGFCLCMIFMVIEALTLHHFKLQRHDSMYVFLPLCSYFLFRLLLGSSNGEARQNTNGNTIQNAKRNALRMLHDTSGLQNKNRSRNQNEEQVRIQNKNPDSGQGEAQSKMIRTVSLLVYLIHPWMIVVVRLIAHKLRLEELLIANSLVHFCAVCVLSLVFGVAVIGTQRHFHRMISD